MRAYALLIASVLACRLALGAVSIEYKTAGQQLMLQWWFLPLIAAWGATGVLLLRKTDFARVATTRRGAVIAALHGVAVGVATIGLDVVEPTNGLHYELPESLLIYWIGAVTSEIVFHLLPVPLLAWMTRHNKAAFWSAALILASWEGRRFLTQPELWDAVGAARFAVTYLANVSEIWLFRRFGFMAAVTQRAASYSLWHIAWP